MRRLGLFAIVLAVLAALLVPSTAAVVAAGSRSSAVPTLTVTHQVRGLSIPWDVRPLPGGRLLIDERSNRRLIVWHQGVKRVLTGFPASKVWASGETGVMGLAV